MCQLFSPSTFFCSKGSLVLALAILSCVLLIYDGVQHLRAEKSVYNNYVQTSDIIHFRNFTDPNKYFTIYYFPNESCSYNHEPKTKVPSCLEMQKNKSLAVHSDYCSYTFCSQNNTNEPLYICHTPTCWMQQQQKDCVQQMRLEKCNISYSCKTTYLCPIYPHSAIDKCNTSCPGLQCRDYSSPYIWPLTCTVYTNMICPIYRYSQIYYLTNHTYVVNKISYPATSKENLCYVYDITCQKQIQRASTITIPIYYDKTDPSQWTSDISTEASSHTITKLFFGPVFGVIAIYMFYYVSADANCCVDVNQYHIAEDGKGAQTCPICYDNLSSRVIKKLKCKHMFHQDCINHSLDISPLCPICRADNV